MTQDKTKRRPVEYIINNISKGQLDRALYHLRGSVVALHTDIEMFGMSHGLFSMHLWGLLQELNAIQDRVDSKERLTRKQINQIFEEIQDHLLLGPFTLNLPGGKP